MIILWLLFTLGVIEVHLYLIKRKKISPNKVVWWLVRFVVGVAFILMEYKAKTPYLGVVILAYIMSNWFFHDTLIALSIKQRPWYLNDTGAFDKVQFGSPYIWIMKLITCVTLLAMYFFNK
jgi:SNF family Na+-dependent transporter